MTAPFSKKAPAISEEDMVADLRTEIEPYTLAELRKEITRYPEGDKRRILLEKQLAENETLAAEAQAEKPVHMSAEMPGVKRIMFEGQEHVFPADFSDEEIQGALMALPAASKPATDAQPAGATDAQPQSAATPWAAHKGKVDAFGKTTLDWIQATGGVLKPGQTVQQAVAEWSGTPDPSDTQAEAEQQHLAETGELVYGESVVYNAVKPIAAIAGFTRRGPMGATGAEALVRAVTLANNLKTAVDAGTINLEQAEDIFITEMGKGVATDAAFNYGVPLLGKAAAYLGPKIPGVKALIDKVKPFMEKAAAKAAQAVTPDLEILRRTLGTADDAAVPAADDVFRAEKIQRRQDLTDNPARKEAVKQLTDRAKAAGSDVIPTPGQVTGEAGRWETNVRKGSQITFDRADKVMEQSADDMLRAATTPEGQLERKYLGEAIHDVAEQTAVKMKQRLRPVFDEADSLGVKVDMSPVRLIASRERLANSKVPNGMLNPKEVAELDGIFEHLRNKPLLTPEAVLDFISRRKEVLRNTTADWKPSQRFNVITDKLVEAAEREYAKAAKLIGRPEVTRKLLQANTEYRDTMSTVFTDAVRDALKKNPEDVGRFFWQTGNISEIEQLHKLLSLANREGALGVAGAEKIKRDVARGFLQDGMKDLHSAAKWSQNLKENTKLRETWNLLTDNPDGKALRDMVAIVEQAAQIAEKNNLTLTGGTLQAISRASQGGVGVTYTQGKVSSPGWFIGGLGLTGVVKAAATAYTNGQRGVINSIAKAMRLRDVGTPAATKAMQAEVQKIMAWAKENGVDLSEEQPEQSAQQSPQQPQQSTQQSEQLLSP